VHVCIGCVHVCIGCVHVCIAVRSSTYIYACMRVLQRRLECICMHVCA